ncbi:MAG: NADAR family protein, partial [Proteobacteria bacterium]|nr:NADAR family protein [Pseudomonadota bacterium]
KLKEENIELTRRLNHVEEQNRKLTRRVCALENKLLESNVIFSGIPESTWEEASARKEKIIEAIASTVLGQTYQERYEVAKWMTIKNTRRIGTYKAMKTRPISVEFMNKEDAEYVLQNRKYLPEQVFVDKEYCQETEESRKVLRPYLRAARKLTKYQKKCKLDGDTLIIKGITYNVNTLDKLPDDLNGFNISSKSTNNVFGFFGNLNPFSNFHQTPFIYEDKRFHCSEQYIQFTKAIHFKDKQTSELILNATNAWECKQLSKEITNYDKENWERNAKLLCSPGINSKFEQHPTLQQLLLTTHDKVIVECCYDPVWGTGVPLHDEDSLNPAKWNNQGILGEILEDIRARLKTTHSTATREGEMDTTPSIPPPPENTT